MAVNTIFYPCLNVAFMTPEGSAGSKSNNSKELMFDIANFSSCDHLDT